MRETLKLFTNNSALQEASEALLDKLGIKFSPLLRGVPFDDYFRQSSFNFHYVGELEKCINHIWNIGYVNSTTFENDDANDENAKYFGLSIFACDIKPEVSFTRSMAVALTRAFNRISTQNVNNQFDMPVVVIMRQGEMLSLATCERSGRQDGHGERVGKVTILRDMNCSHLHAGHKQILERVKENVRGCKSYEELHQKWFESFNIDILSDNFFNGYKNIYEDIIEYITGKRMVKQANKWVEQDNKNPNAAIMAEFSCFDDPEKAVRDYVKNLMGRLVFIQFLQKKGWMGVPAGKSWNGGDPDFLQNLFHTSEHKEDFVDKVLEPLFEDLNTPRENDLVSHPNVHNGNQIKVPYLNGGLFDISNSDSTTFRIPSRFFWNEDESEATKSPGILRLFSNYNFTIDENAPDNVEIGVDPEMLSRIFENLLEDNKEKGAFYTPKEIVRYMCQESLIAYLDTNTSIASEKIRKFVMSPEEGVYDIPDGKKGKLIEALKEVKICDPAIGSGAFPMGMLNELLHCHEVLSNQHDNRTDIKKSIIKENLYGVDIEKGAVDIARLRFWLSIVVDEETPSPMPNLDYKIMQGNSLIESFKGIDLSKLTYEKEDKTDKGDFSLFDDEKNRLQKTVSHLLASYYSCSDHDRKVKLQQEISETINKQLESQSYKSEILAQLKDINLAENNRFFLWHTWFSDVFNRDKKSGFDIVIGNPPYVSTKGREEDEKRILIEKYGFADDLYSHFIFLAFNLLRENGVQTMITSDTYFTTVMKSNVRKELLKNTILQLVHWGYDIFPEAMVSTSTFIAQKTKSDENHSFVVYDMKGRKTLTNASKYFVPKQKYQESLNGSFFIPTPLCDAINEKYGITHYNLLEQWWEKISTSKNIAKHSNILEKYRQELKSGDIALMGCLTEGGQGLATANNGKYVAIKSGTKWADKVIKSRYKKLTEAVSKYKIATSELNGKTPEDFLSTSSEAEIAEVFDALKERYGRDIFGQGYLYKLIDECQMANLESLTDEEKESGIDSSKNFWVPYDKGDKDGNRWYLETPYAIAWSKDNVTSLKTDPKARYQGYTFYFKEGFCYSDIKTFFLRCRLKGVSIHDVKSMSLFPLSEKVPYYYIVTLINSHLMATVVYNFLNNTPSFQINDCRALPVIIPTESQLEECKILFDKAISVQKEMFAGIISSDERDALLVTIQDEIDAFVYKLYGIETTDYLNHINKPYVTIEA